MFTFRKQLTICLALFIAIAGQLWVLKSLDYSTSSVSWLLEEELINTPPTPNFRLGSFEWNVEAYSRAPELVFFREYFQQNCRGLKGTAAASCLSENLIRKIPKGLPKHEIFDADFSPEKTFRSHLNGAQGYCVSYAGIAATSLLSVGIPARFLQMRPSGDIGGHNIIEVWDDQKGWVLFDPFNDGLIESDGKYLSGFEAMKTDRVHRVKAGNDRSAEGHLANYYERENPFKTTVVYPEPWLYTRVDQKVDPLYRGSFLGFGKGYFRYSVIQSLLRIGIILCILMFLSAFIYGLWTAVRLVCARSEQGSKPEYK